MSGENSAIPLPPEGSLAALTVEQRSPSGVLLVMTGGRIAQVELAPELLKPDNLGALAASVRDTFTAVYTAFADKVAELCAPPQDPELARLTTVVQALVADLLRQFPPTQATSSPQASPDPRATTIEERGVRVSFVDGWLTQVTIEDEVVWMSRREVADSLRTALNRGLELPPPVIDVDDSEPVTVDDLQEVIQRADDAKRGIYRRR